jgi:superfamily II RNA helicase
MSFEQLRDVCRNLGPNQWVEVTADDEFRAVERGKLSWGGWIKHQFGLGAHGYFTTASAVEKAAHEKMVALIESRTDTLEVIEKIHREPEIEAQNSWTNQAHQEVRKIQIRVQTVCAEKEYALRELDAQHTLFSRLISTIISIVRTIFPTEGPIAQVNKRFPEVYLLQMKTNRAEIDLGKREKNQSKMAHQAIKALLKEQKLKGEQAQINDRIETHSFLSKARQGSFPSTEDGDTADAPTDETSSPDPSVPPDTGAEKPAS